MPGKPCPANCTTYRPIGIFNTFTVTTYVFIRIFGKRETLKTNRYELKSYFQFVRAHQDIVRVR